jgi:hypothetical protein
MSFFVGREDGNLLVENFLQEEMELSFLICVLLPFLFHSNEITLICVEASPSLSQHRLFLISSKSEHAFYFPDAQLLESQRNQVPSLHNFWYLRKPSSARQDLNEDTPPEGTLEGTLRKKLRGFCLQSPLLGNERSVSSDIQAMSQDTQERGMALDVSRVSMTASSMKVSPLLILSWFVIIRKST